VKRNAVYVATGDNYSDPPTDTSDAVMAFDRGTGKLLWSRQMTTNDTYNLGCEVAIHDNCPDSKGPDFDFGQPPILVSLPNGKQELVIAQKSAVAWGIDPDQQGKVLWQTTLGKGSSLGGSMWGSAADERSMYVAISDVGFRPVKDQAGKFELDPATGGGVFALDLLSGKTVWSASAKICEERKNCSPAQPAAVAVIPGVVFEGSMDGHFRAYASSSGEIIWDFDTAREYDTVNGERARGGAIDGGGAAIVGGMVYVYSGYGQWGGMPGNVLLAFSVEGK
jgi:polyvinyl alcohol dehydrogenase (cytochrome)